MIVYNAELHDELLRTSTLLSHKNSKARQILSTKSGIGQSTTSGNLSAKSASTTYPREKSVAATSAQHFSFDVNETLGQKTLQPFDGLTTSLNKPKKSRQQIAKKRQKMKIFHEHMEAQRAEEDKRTKELLRLKKKREHSQFEERLRAMEASEGVYQDVVRLLNEYDSIQNDKKSKLYRTWNNNFYGKIHGRIKKKLHGFPPRLPLSMTFSTNSKSSQDAITLKKQNQLDMYQKYLEETNKRAVFLDAVRTKEYDPWAWREMDTKVPVGDLVDPIKADLIKYETEKDLIRQNMENDGDIVTNQEDPLRRLILSPRDYDKMSHLPKCRDEKILKRLESNPKKLDPNRKAGGNVLPDHFNIERDCKVAQKEYFPNTKRYIQPEFMKYQFNISDQW